MAQPVAALRADAIDRVRILGAKFTLDQRDTLSAAKIGMSVTQTTQLTLTFSDPGFKALNNGAGVLGTRVDFDDFALHIAAVETVAVGGIEGFTLACRPIVVSNLKNRRGPKVMTNVSPSDFVRAEAKAAGFKSWVVQDSPRRKQVARDVPEKGKSYDANAYPSSWTTFQRLANELGFYIFEVANTLYFGKPTWLMNRPGVLTVKAGFRAGPEGNQMLDVPTCRKTYDSKQTTISMSMPSLVAPYFLPGRRLNTTGLAGFSKNYLLSGLSYDLARRDSPIEVEGETPLDPEPQPAATSSSGSKTSTDSGGSGNNSTSGTRRNTKMSGDFVYWAQRQLGDRYVFGAPVSSSSDPTKFDCSSLVKWAASMVGIYMPRTSGEQIDYCTRKGTRISVETAKDVRGALLWKPGHVAISLGNGRTIEAANSRVGVVNYGIGNRFTRAARLPGMKY